MLYFAENLRKLRLSKDLTQEDIANFLGITPQSVSKWERGETYPDITLLPPLANILETSIDMLLGMDTIRAAETLHGIHARATKAMQSGRYAEAETIYRDALLCYPNKPSMLLGLGGVLALKDETHEAAALIERGLALTDNEKQKATMRAVLCFLYKKNGDAQKAKSLAADLPHTRESREVIVPLVAADLDDRDIERQVRLLLLGE